MGGYHPSAMPEQVLESPFVDVVVCGEGAPDESEQELRALGAAILRLPQLGGRLDLALVLQALAQRGVNELMIESGATLAGEALIAGIVDEMVLYVAPHLMGHAARGLVNLPGVDHMAQRVAVQFADVRRIGQDLRLTLRTSVMSGIG